jgi:hypothetical protein
LGNLSALNLLCLTECETTELVQVPRRQALVTSEGIQQIPGGLEVLDEDLLLRAPVHADLLDVEVWRLVRREKDVVMRGVLVPLELGRRDVTAEMVIATGGEMAGAEHLLILDVRAGHRKHLGAETELSEHAGHGVIQQAGIVSVDGGLVAGDELALDDAAARDGELAERAVLILHGEVAFSTGGDKVDLARRQVCHIRGGATTEAVRLLRLLAAELELRGEHFTTFETEVDLHGVRFCHRETQLFSIAADFFIIDGKTAVEDDLIDAMKSGATETILLGKGGERRGGGEGGDGQDDVVVWIDVFLQAEAVPLHVHALIGQVQIAAAGLHIGVHLTALERELLHHAILQSIVEVLAGTALDGTGRILQESQVLGLAKVRQINEDADLAAKGRLENRVQKSVEVKFGELAAIGRGLDSGHGGGHDNNRG